MGVYTTINDPSAYFHIQLYNGNGGANTITNNANAGNFQPDWTWIKERGGSSSHQLFDSSRGDKVLYSDSAVAEDTTNYFTENTNGFTLAANNGINQNGINNVAWQWKCNGGTTATNTDGATNGYNTTVQANQTAGFSIVQWNAAFDQGNGRYNLGHGLGKTADFIIIKNRSSSGDWYVHHKDIDDNDYLRLNLNNATSNTSAR